jgi:exodeoxyribonuclease VII large subunit
MNPKPETIISVGQLNKQAKDILENHMGRIWVEGEISNLARPRSGHLYWTLKDAQAQVQCAWFRPSHKPSAHSLDNGQQVWLFGKVTLYPTRGDYQLIIDNVMPAGLGALEIAFQQLKEKLAKLGWFDESRKKPIPRFPDCIGIITSKTGAALQDIKAVLQSRYPCVQVIVYPCDVQGENCVPSNCQALIQAEQDQQADVLLLTRGGGSLEDLWGYNDERLAKAILDCKIPVITGIGHEIDTTIADWVSDCRAPTPSAAAMRATPNRQDLQQILATFSQKLQFPMMQRHAQLTQQLQQFRLLLKDPMQQVQEANYTLDQLTVLLNQAIKNQWVNTSQKLAIAREQLACLNPKSVLNRGYAYVEHGQKMIISAKSINPGDTLTVHFNNGQVDATVDHIKTED